MKPEITITLTEEEALAVFQRLQKPNKLDDFSMPIKKARIKIGLRIGLNPFQPKTAKNVYKHRIV